MNVRSQSSSEGRASRARAIPRRRLISSTFGARGTAATVSLACRAAALVSAAAPFVPSLEVSKDAAAKTAHFVVDLATDPLGDHWIYAGSLTPFNKSDAATVAHPPGEPTPVYEDGAPGDAATVRYFIARQPTGHKGPRALAIGLYKLSWLPPQ